VIAFVVGRRSVELAQISLASGAACFSNAMSAGIARAYSDSL
jgi:hypothetical protein